MWYIHRRQKSRRYCGDYVIDPVVQKRYNTFVMGHVKLAGGGSNLNSQLLRKDRYPRQLMGARE